MKMASKFAIKKEDLMNLTNDSLGIRLLTFKTIFGTFHDASKVSEKVKADNAILLRQLIRWFSFKPIQVPLLVLDIIENILNNPEEGSTTRKLIGAQRLLRELDKIRYTLKKHPEEREADEKIQTIKYHLDCALKESCTKENDNPQLFQKEINGENEKNSKLFGYNANGLSKLYPVDYEAMKTVSDILVNPLADADKIEQVIQHLQITLCDYPVDFLLQPPHIFRNLLFLYDERNSSEFHCQAKRLAASTLLCIIGQFYKNLSISRKSSAHFVPTKQSSKTIQSNTTSKDSAQTCRNMIENALRQLLTSSCAYLELHLDKGCLLAEIWEIIYNALNLYIVFDLNITTAFDVGQIVKMINILKENFGVYEYCTRLRLCQMQLLFLLKDILKLFFHQHQTIDADACLPMLKDYIIKCLFPKKYEEHRLLIFRSKKSLHRELLVLDRYEEAFQYGIDLLRKSPTKHVNIDVDCIAKYREICLIMDKLHSKVLFDRIFDHIVACNHLYCKDAKLLILVKELLQEMLFLTWPTLKKHIYSKFEYIIKQFIGCLMSDEPFSMFCTNTTLLEAEIVGVALSKEFLEHLIYEGNASEENNDDNSNEIKSHCFEILAILLKSHNLFGKCWTNFLQLLIPILPLLSCCIESKEIMNTLIKLYNPDYKALPTLCILKGNISFLFHDNLFRRTEALTRLIYILNTDPEAYKLIPNIFDIKDTLPNELCFAVDSRDLNAIFDNVQVSLKPDVKVTLKNLCYLLDTSDVEPLTRKSTLMQINVLCSSWLATAELCKMGANFLILYALQNALQRASTKEYPDSVEPAIGCLAKILLCDANARCQLAENSIIYVLLLRAMMLLVNNMQVRQDASVCLLLLLFAKQINVTPEHIESNNLLQKIQSPLKLKFISPLLKKDITDDEKSLQTLFNSVAEEQNYWRFAIAHRYSDSFQNIALQSIEKQIGLADINNNLQLSQSDIRWIRYSQPILCTEKLIHAISNATEHHALIQAAIVIKTHILFYKYAGISNFSTSMQNKLWRSLARFIQLRPGNAEDVELFEHTLDVIILCVRAQLSEIITTVLDSLNKDKLHALVTLLTNKEVIPLHIYYKITVLLKELFQNGNETGTKSNRKGLVSELFDTLLQNTIYRFSQRDLNRVRCLLQILVALSARDDLTILDEILLGYCKKLYNITISLKSHAQTGAQIQRDCLLCVLQLGEHIKKLSQVFWVQEYIVHFVSNLCRHNDAEIRILAWSLLHMISEGCAPPVTQKIIKDKNSSVKDSSSKENDEPISYEDGGHFLLEKLNKSLGGFPEYCLKTLLNTEEVMCIRVSAGQLFSSLITHKHNNLEKTIKMLEKCRFLDIGLNILKSMHNCVLSTEITNNKYELYSRGITTCDLIGCFANVCSNIGLHSVSYINKLCEHNFMLRLYEVTKLSLPEALDPIIYLRMVADICRVYTLCSSNYSNNFVLLQRTICRDAVWLRSLCHILFVQQDITQILKREKESGMLLDVLTLFTVLLKDYMAFEQISYSICSMPNEFTQFFINIFTISEVESCVQGQALSILTILLLKSQPERIAEENITGILSILIEEATNKECVSISNSQIKEENEKDLPRSGKLLCLSLIRLLTHVYPLRECKFDTSPTAAQQQIVECLALLLKVSTQAQQTADALKLKDKIIKIFQTFFDELSTYTCTTFIRRQGEARKNAVIKNFLLLITFLVHWFSSPSTMITDDRWAETISKILIQIWPWLAYSPNLKLKTFQLCAFLSEKSFVIIKKFAILNTSSFQHSVLQHLIKSVTSETMKVKANTTEYAPSIVTGLRVLMNCCACVEGRAILQKARVLDIIDVIYPFNPKATRLRIDIVRAWLQFWELYTRYEEGASAHHLTALCSVINRQESYSEIRLISLQILRNIAFLDKNRSLLMTSKEFLYSVFEVLSQSIDISTTSYEEQLLISTTLWKLVSGGIKYVSLIRGTRLAKQLSILEETIESMYNENREIGQYAQELLQVLAILTKIFSNA